MNFIDAIREWSELLGRPHVVTDEGALEPYARSTLPSAPRPRAVVLPGSAEDVAGTVAIASRHGIPLYPISRGKNSGYGDACPVTVDQVVVDLGRMNRILDVDRRLAYAVIEPGVTQGQLSAHLRDKGIPLMLDCTGAGPDASIVGNILERGFGHTPYGNRTQTICGMEIVLADGRVLKTGFGHYDGAQSRHVFPYGIGPWIDGLFTQSNLGIVTSIGIWLMPKPECFTFFSCFIDRHEDLGPVIEHLRPLRLNGTLRSIVHIGNDLRLIQSKMTYPRERTGGVVPLPDEVRRSIRAEQKLGAWVAAGGLYGTKGQVREAKRAIGAALRGPGRKLVFIDEGKLALGRRVAGLLSWTSWGRTLESQLRAVQPVIELNQGKPSGHFLAGAYWRNRKGLSVDAGSQRDLRADNCGMIWLSPVLPMTGEAALELLGLVGPIFARHGFDLPVTLSMVNERALGAVLTICFDKDDPDESQRATACYDEAFAAVVDAGYLPYRAGIQSMAHLGRRSSVFWDFIAELKTAADPKGVLAPGRYQPGPIG